ncbi:MAG: ECF-type riboflavin transporter substrate-binding protein [Treponema sp.]|jgi:class 3 adenylate cyclase/uncharacterized membrane protein|nr:ECF-type riboflavin transporter substrate-binding protein [Treponema sp.]
MDFKSILVKIAKFLASVLIGAGLMFVLNRFISIPTGVPDTYIQLGIPVLALFAAVLGPLAGFLIGFIGHTLVDLSWGGIWWSWVFASAFFGLAVGSFRSFFKIEEGKFGVKRALIFNGIQAAANITAYVFITRTLDLVIYNEHFAKITLQGFVAAGINIAAVLIMGTTLAIGYSKTLIKTGRQKRDNVEDHEMSYSKRINHLAKAIMVRLMLGMFFISSLMTLLISELVNRQTDNYRKTVTEVTGHHLTSAVTALSHLISSEELDLFHTVEDMDNLAYEEIRKQLIKFSEENDVKYAYYWRDVGDGRLQYIIDNDTDPETQVGPGDFDDISQDAEREALAGRISVSDLGSYTLGWEGLLSAYAPVYDTTGHHLISSVTALAKLVSAEELSLFHTVEDMQKPEYEEIRQRLMKFGEDNSVKYAYFWRAVGNGRFQYIIDNDTDPETQVGPGDFNIIAQDAEREALAGKISASEIGSYSPGWEGLRSAYAPVYDSRGNIYAVAGVDINESKVYAVAGVDISDEFIFMQYKDARNMTLLQLIVVPISVLFGVMNMFLYRRKAIQIEEAHLKLQFFNNNLRRAFSTYLSEDVVEEIVADPTRLQLGGIKRHMTAIFTDVRGFTGIAEHLTPEHLVDLLNHYLSTMSDVILEQKGTIDKYEGDAIIAFFGAPLELPDHAIRACTAAVVMKRFEADVNKYVIENGISPSPLLTRIGINSGEMVVGNMGTQKKMNYTIISNAVNLAARLEGVNKQYGTWILTTENTIRETAGWFLTRRLDRIRVVGIKEPVQIYEILETMEHSTEALRHKVNLFHNALDLFEERNWKSAEQGFYHILEQFPDDGPSGLYLNRCRQYIANKPSPDWDGVFNILEK